MENIEYFREWLKDLNMDRNDFAVFGSWPLYLRGITSTISDIDLVVRPQSWESATKLWILSTSYLWHPKIIINESLEMFLKRAPGDWNVDELIDTADVVEGIRFVSLGNVLKWKKLYNREKDQLHIKLIQEYLKENGKKI